MTLIERRAKVTLKRLDALTVRDGSPIPDYSRSEFGSGWRDNDGDGQNERAEVLIDWHRPGRGKVRIEFATGLERRVVSGRWRCRFSGNWLTDASDLDIDHLVPLAEAWASGAHGWDRDRRVKYANGVGIRSRKRSWLLPVTASLNRSKGAQRPDEWMPPRREYRIIYLSDWIWTKTYWGLSLDPVEEGFCRQHLLHPLG